MVEMMLMQNAQMHQIIMQNMMLKAIPPLAMSLPGGAGHQVPHTPHQGQVCRPPPTHTHIHMLACTYYKVFLHS